MKNSVFFPSKNWFVLMLIVQKQILSYDFSFLFQFHRDHFSSAICVKKIILYFSWFSSFLKFFHILIVSKIESLSIAIESLLKTDPWALRMIFWEYEEKIEAHCYNVNPNISIFMMDIKIAFPLIIFLLIRIKIIPSFKIRINLLWLLNLPVIIFHHFNIGVCKNVVNCFTEESSLTRHNIRIIYRWFWQKNFFCLSHKIFCFTPTDDYILL